MSVNPNGYFEGHGAKSYHYHDLPLAQSLITFFKNQQAKTIADFGCGLGDYVKAFIKEGIQATGFDGNPCTPELTENVGKVLDLSKPITFDTPFDWVMSLEVGEHLPQEFETIFIENLHNNNKHGIVLSWAVKGQGGVGHYNEQNNDYVKSKICALGYTNDVESENILRNNSSLHWFKNTIMVFKKVI